jgi:hypothetical protein
MASEFNKNSIEEELRSYTDENRVLLFSESRPCQIRFLKLSPKTKSIEHNN